MKKEYSPIRSGLLLAALAILFVSGSTHAQGQAIGFKPGTAFSEGYVVGNTLYVAGQQGPGADGKLTGADMTAQATSAIGNIQKVVEQAGFKMTDLVSVTVFVTSLDDVAKMNDVYKKLIPDPKPARTTVQVAGLIGGAKIEITAIAVKH